MIGLKYKHLKSGHIYKVLDEVTWEPDGSVITIYQLDGHPNSIKWARYSSVFYDGRFQKIDQS